MFERKTWFLSRETRTTLPLHVSHPDVAIIKDPCLVHCSFTGTNIFITEDEELNLKLLIIVMRCVIWYQLYILKNMQNTHRRVLLLVKLQAFSLQFTKSNTPPWVFSGILNCTNGTKSRRPSHIIL